MSKITPFILVSDFTLSRPAAFGDFRARTTGLHVALLVCNSGAESGRELFKGSKDMGSLLVCTEEKFFGWGLQIFVCDCCLYVHGHCLQFDLLLQLPRASCLSVERLSFVEA